MLPGLLTGLRRQRPAQSGSALLPLLLLLTPAAAHPYPKDDVHDIGLGYLMPRDCVQYCGYNNMYCCGSGQECYTSSGIAGCKNTAAGGGYNLYTTTWTLTETFTSTYTSLFPAATTVAPALCVPEAGSGQIACGTICCANWQYCAYEGQCSANAGWIGGGGTTTAVNTQPKATATTTSYTTYTSSGVVITTPYSAPYRVTSGTGTSTGVAVGASGTGVVTSTTSSSHLSGGAIAGIVIGTLAGIALLIGICACFLVRGLWHGLMSLLGFRKRNREEEVIIEEERIHRHSAGGRSHSGWYGDRPPVDEKKSGTKRWLGIGALAGTLLLLLGLRRKDKKDDRRRPGRSEVSSAYYSDSYMSGPSKYSSSSVNRSRYVG